MFCSNCGGSISDEANFCDHCGAQQGQATPAPCAEAVQQEQKTTKKSRKTIIGIVLLCLQAVAVLGIVASGELSNLTGYFAGGLSGIFEIIGFFLPSIIGAALLVMDHMKKKK